LPRFYEPPQWAVNGILSSRKPTDGLLDEASVSTTTRSAGWIATEYNNQNSPATFYSVGSATAR